MINEPYIVDYWVLEKFNSLHWKLKSNIDDNVYCYFKASPALRARFSKYLNNAFFWQIYKINGNLIGKTFTINEKDEATFTTEVLVLKSNLVYPVKNSFTNSKADPAVFWLPRAEYEIGKELNNKMWNNFFQQKNFWDITQNDKSKYIISVDPYNGKDSKPFVQDEDGQFEKVNKKQKETLDKECREGNITFERFSELVFAIVDDKPTELSDEEFKNLKEQMRNTPITFGDRKPECIPYQLCPKCNGKGTTFSDIPSISTVVTVTCNVCSGKMIIPMYKP